jgi:hypothetical protein
LFCVAQAIQSWSEEFKVQLASGGAGDEGNEEEEEEEDEEDDGAEAQALLDFAEAIEHRCVPAPRRAMRLR